MEQQSSADSAETEVEGIEPTDKSKKSGAIVKIALFVVAVAIGGTLGFTTYEKVTTLRHGGGENTEDLEEPVEYGEFFELTGIIVNPSKSAGKRYLMVNIGLEGNPDTISDVETKQIVIRDMIINSLGRLTIDALSDITRRDSMKTGLLSSVNAIISEGNVDRLYFTQYVIQ